MSKAGLSRGIAGALLVVMVFTTGCKAVSMDSITKDVDSRVNEDAFNQESAVSEGQVSPENMAGGTDTMITPETDVDGNILEPTQSVGRVGAMKKEQEKETKAPVPVQDTELGDWLKTRDGFMFKSKETGEYITSSIMNIGEYVYFFDENGVLRDNVFVPTSEGTKFISGYKYLDKGFVELDGNKYYLSPDEGRLELCKAKINGELYCFDEDGIIISETKWDSKYGQGTETSEQSTDALEQDTDTSEQDTDTSEQGNDTSEQENETLEQSTEDNNSESNGIVIETSEMK